MFSLRNRFGIPGVISVIALVFAMLGGAYAASSNGGGSRATASKAGKRGPRGPKGATGPAGPAGAAGAAGAKGATGATGTNGAPGANGKSVTVTPAGELDCGGLGGAIVKQEGAASGTEVCNGAEGVQGPEGKPWTDGGTLPVGATETGVWSFTTSASTAYLVTQISFPIRLAAPLGEANVHFSTEAGFGVTCKGTAANPTAPSGNLCVYQEYPAGEFQGILTVSSDISASGADTTGTLLAFAGAPASAIGFGTWAVTG